MKNQIPAGTQKNTMKSIKINSGFRSGGCLLQWDGEKFDTIAAAHENTRTDDGDSSFAVTVLDGFKGAIVRFWGTCNSAELLGFSESELIAPSPVQGWASCDSSIARASDNWQVWNMLDYLKALARGARILTVQQAVKAGTSHPSGNGLVLVNLGLEAGDQAADAWAVVDSTTMEVVEEQSGCGDGTPIPVATSDGWQFTCARREQARAQWEAQEESVSQQEDYFLKLEESFAQQ